jgi:TRAP-type C4-dicarboxylate transport system permease small subunit
MLDWFLASLVFIIMIVTFVDVWGRYFLNAPLYGAADIIAHLMAMIVFAALPRVSMKHQHITVDLMDGYMPVFLRKPRDLAIGLICAACFCYMAWQTWFLSLDFMEYGDTSKDLLIPKAWIGFYITFSTALTATLVIIVSVLEMVGKFKPAETSPTDSFME